MELKATDLRIGNLVNDEDGQPMYIAGIWPTQGGDRFIDSAGNTGKLTILSGIELSSDILLKTAISYEFFHDGVIIYKFGKFNVYQQSGIIWVAEGLNHGKDYKHIKHLHQIQNLYYILDGTELHINI